MRPSHILAALGATTTTFAQAQDTKPNPDQVAQGTDCSSSTTTTWALPSTSAPSTIPANFTVTLIDAPANSTTPTLSSGDFTLTITSAGTGAVTATSSSSPAAATSSNSAAAAAAAGEGLASDSSMLGLVIFFALSLCLL